MVFAEMKTLIPEEHRNLNLGWDERSNLDVLPACIFACGYIVGEPSGGNSRSLPCRLGGEDEFRSVQTGRRTVASDQ